MHFNLNEDIEDLIVFTIGIMITQLETIYWIHGHFDLVEDKALFSLQGI